MAREKYSGYTLRSDTRADKMPQAGRVTALASARIPLSPWRLPAKIWLTRAGGEPAIDFAGWTPHSKFATAEHILERFCQLERAKPAQVLSFARRYGPLQLGADGLPAGQRLPWNPQPPELVGRYRCYAALCNAILRASMALKHGEGIARADYRIIAAAWNESVDGDLGEWISSTIHLPYLPELEDPLPEEVVCLGERLAPSRWPTESELVEAIVAWWIETAGVRPHLSWYARGAVPSYEVDGFSERGTDYVEYRSSRRTRPAFRFEAPLAGPLLTLGGSGAWGALAVKLSETIAGLSQAKTCRCYYCGHWFLVNRHRPASVRPCCGTGTCRQARERVGRADRRGKNSGYLSKSVSAEGGASPGLPPSLVVPHPDTSMEQP
jgi:hypothetical protein